MSVERIRKNDTVVAVSGVDRGKTGKILQVVPSSGRAIVEGLCMRKKALRKSQENPQGGIVEKEGSLPLSNLMPYCPECKKGVRIKKGRNGEERTRNCARCGYSFDG